MSDTQALELPPAVAHPFEDDESHNRRVTRHHTQLTLSEIGLILDWHDKGVPRRRRKARGKS